MDASTLRLAPRQFVTARLRLEAPQVAHAAALLTSVQASWARLRYIGWAQTPWDQPRSVRFCQDGLAMVEAGEYIVFHAFLQDSGTYVGRVDLHSFDFDTPRAEVGYVGDVHQAGQGLMREAVRAVLGMGFELGLARIQALSEASNQRALHFASALGFTREGVLRHYERDAQGRLGEQVMFSMLPHELR